MATEHVIITGAPSADLTALPSFTKHVLNNITASQLHAASPKDLIYLPLRFAKQINRRVFLTFPRYILTISGIEGWARIASQNMNDLFNGAGEAVAGAMGDAAQAAAGEAAGQVGPAGWKRAFADALQLGNARSYWGMLNYMTSRWAFACFSMVRLRCKIKRGRS